MWQPLSNTGQERVVFVSLRLTDQTQGHPVHISCPATASRHGRVKGLRWKSDIYQEKWGWWSSILAEYSAVLSGEWNICSLTILADSFVMYAVYFWHYCIMILGESVVLYNTDRPKWFLLNWRSRAVHLCTKKKKKIFKAISHLCIIYLFEFSFSFFFWGGTSVYFVIM